MYSIVMVAAMAVAPESPDFFKKGGGPVLDVGVYYITALVNLLGPVARVHSLTSSGFEERIVTSPGPRTGLSSVGLPAAIASGGISSPSPARST